MTHFFERNIDNKGRLMRGLISVLFFVGAGASLAASPWLAGLLAIAGAFVAFEALRGWCVARACGIKTKL